jgi:hypothetical protein
MDNLHYKCFKFEKWKYNHMTNKIITSYYILTVKGWERHSSSLTNHTKAAFNMGWKTRAFLFSRTLIHFIETSRRTMKWKSSSPWDLQKKGNIFNYTMVYVTCSSQILVLSACKFTHFWILSFSLVPYFYNPMYLYYQ